jgi:gamma-glutamylcyclotransferase (GGCT)/AIG2-like uncharacterized protein YtfP
LKNTMAAKPGTTLNRRLFCYGSLRIAKVMRAVIGRVPPGREAELEDHAPRRIRDASYPGAAPLAGAKMPGCVYEGVSDAEFLRLDEFEGEPYSRELRKVRLADGALIEAWVYLLPAERLDWLTDEPWDLESFRRDGLSDFMRHCFGDDGD